MSDDQTQTAPASWAPHFSLDLEKAKPSEFLAGLKLFNQWAKDQPPLRDDERLKDGWHIIGGRNEQTERFLINNAMNRKPTLNHLKYLMRQMQPTEAGAPTGWQETGQPVIFTKSGGLADGGHRVLTSYLAGLPFPTYVVNLRKDVPNLFAFMDNNKARTGKDALQTGGFDGAAPIMSRVVGIAVNYDEGSYERWSVISKRPKLSPIEELDFATSHDENLRLAVHEMLDEYKIASDLFLSKEVACFVAFKIRELYGHQGGEMVEKFMTDVMSDDPSNAVALLVEWLEGQRELPVKQRYRQHQVLMLIIKSFNAWVSNLMTGSDDEPTNPKVEGKKRKSALNEVFPALLGPDDLDGVAPEPE